jgi:hypothetical protein
MGRNAREVVTRNGCLWINQCQCALLRFFR